MKRCIVALGLLAAVMAVGLTWVDRAQGGLAKPVELTPEMKALAEGSNKFAFDLYAKLATAQKGNLIFSPLSVHVALAMAYAGAKGNTADQMARTMNYPSLGDKLARVYGNLIRALITPTLAVYGGQPGYELVVSNALWMSKDYSFKPTFTELVKKEYGANLQNLDYTEAEKATKTINETIARQTDDKINDLIPSDAISLETGLILTDAIYFRGRWDSVFWRGNTQNGSFHLSATKTIECPMMHREGYYTYVEGENFQILELPYNHHDFSMLVLLPRKVDGLRSLEKRLSAKQIYNWTKATERVKVKVSFPRFKFTQQFLLSDVLKSLGMRDPFVFDRADFSGMTSARELAISEVIHGSDIAVDEEGTIATSTVAIGVGGLGMAKPKEPKVFNADHPFIFLIRHNTSGAILFVGRLTAP